MFLVHGPPWVLLHLCSDSGPDLGLGKLGSCPGASTTRGLHICCFCCCFLYSSVGWASTAPLLKAAQGPPHVYIRPCVSIITTETPSPTAPCSVCSNLYDISDPSSISSSSARSVVTRKPAVTFS